MILVNANVQLSVEDDPVYKVGSQRQLDGAIQRWPVVTKAVICA